MANLAFLIKRARSMDWGRMLETARTLRGKANMSEAALLKDMLTCALRYNAGYMDYKIAQMYRLNDAQRRTVITRGVSNNIVRAMNDKAYWHFFDDKAEFNTVFADHIGRAWLRMDDQCTEEDFRRFLEGREAALFKPLEGSSGQGIEKLTKDRWTSDPGLFASLRARGDAILEEIVVQHPAMASLCPTSVNTVRVATLLGDRAEGIVYAFVRIGNGKVMDNVDCGGMAARVDLDTGMLKTVAADKQGNVFEKHPMTGTPIVGFQIPYWEEVKAMCLEAMRKVPQVRFVAWDVAVTPSGPLFIEGNSFPSHAVPQFAAHYPDGIGILPEFDRFIDVSSIRAGKVAAP
ncbi:MAG: hypothetical protein IJR97_10885 [Clostridia bacterium]|nr:hypothetical protein [Clostridia bacterium]